MEAEVKWEDRARKGKSEYRDFLHRPNLPYPSHSNNLMSTSPHLRTKQMGVATALHDENENEHQNQIRRRSFVKGGVGVWKSCTLATEIHINRMLLRATHRCCIALTLITYLGHGRGGQSVA